MGHTVLLFHISILPSCATQFAHFFSVTPPSKLGNLRVGSGNANKFNNNSGPHWFTSEIRHLLNRVHNARRKIKQISSASLLTKLDHLEKDLGEAIVLVKASMRCIWSPIFATTLPSYIDT